VTDNSSDADNTNLPYNNFGGEKDGYWVRGEYEAANRHLGASLELQIYKKQPGSSFVYGEGDNDGELTTVHSKNVSKFRDNLAAFALVKQRLELGKKNKEGIGNVTASATLGAGFVYKFPVKLTSDDFPLTQSQQKSVDGHAVLGGEARATLFANLGENRNWGVLAEAAYRVTAKDIILARPSVMNPNRMQALDNDNTHTQFKVGLFYMFGGKNKVTKNSTTSTTTTNNAPVQR
jgi:hypothetical protein